MQIQISWLLQKPTVGFFRSQLIWIYTVFKGRVYPCSAGQGLKLYLDCIQMCTCKLLASILPWICAPVCWCLSYSTGDQDKTLVRKTGSDISTTLIQGFNFTNSRFQLHEFTISTSRIHDFNFTNSTSRIQLHEFTNSTSRIHEFNFMNSRIQLHEFNFTNSTS